MSGERPAPVDLGVDEEPAQLVRRANRGTWLAFGAFAVLVGVSFYGAYLTAGLPVAVLVGAGVFALGGAPAFEVTATYRLATDATPDAVRETVTEPANPFTANWIAVADHAREPADGEAADVVLVRNRSTPFVSAREVPITIEERADDVRIHVDDEQTPARHRVAIEAADGETIVDLTVRRQGVPGYALVPFWLVRRSLRRRFEYYGYEVREEGRSIALSP